MQYYISQVEAAVSNQKEKGKGDENRIENLLYIILEGQNIKKEHFHRGSMNDVCSRCLLDNVESIFKEIRELASEQLK